MGKMKKGDVLRKWVAGIDFRSATGQGTYSYYQLVFAEETVINKEGAVKTLLTYGPAIYTHELSSEQIALWTVAAVAIGRLKERAELKMKRT